MIVAQVLDAPELQDDFYLNLVDWSSQNVLSVGLGACVYLWAAATSQVFILSTNCLLFWGFFFVKFWRITSASSFGCPPSEDWFILILETNFLFKCHRFDDLEVTYFLLRNLMNPNHRMLSVSQPRSIFHMITKTFHYDCTQIYLFHLELTHLIEEMLRLLIMNSWCMDKKLFCADFRSRGCAI